MTRLQSIPLSLGLVLFSLLPAIGQERTLVGKKLPSLSYFDTEGQEIRGEMYEGSVLVMFGGIPW